MFTCRDGKGGKLSSQASKLLYKPPRAVYIYLLLTEFEGRTVSYGPSFFLLDLWPKREARGP